MSLSSINIKIHGQNVLATIVLQIPKSMVSDKYDKEVGDDKTFLRIVSLGYGTKTLRKSLVDTERKKSVKVGTGDRLIRDHHAEVIARRGFLLFLWNLVESKLKNEGKEKMKVPSSDILIRKANG